MDGIISIPGVVPIPGVMLVAQKKDKDVLEVLAATGNSSHVLGYSPEELFGLKSLTEILEEAGARDFLNCVHFIAGDENRPNTGQPIIFPLSVFGPLLSYKQHFWCAVHASPICKDLLIVEFEKVSQNKNFEPHRRPKRKTASRSDFSNRLETDTELHPHSKIRFNEPTSDERAVQVSSILSQFQEQLSRPEDLESLMTTAVWLLKGMLDVEEISVIRFDRDWNGSLMAKLGKHNAGLPDSNWLTATSLPHWQRNIFKRKKVNFQKGRHPILSRLMLRSRESFLTVANLNMSNCLLKTTPLFGQGQEDTVCVQSALVISISACGNLWGVVSCVNYGAAEMDISFLDREFCCQFAEVLSRNVERLM